MIDVKNLKKSFGDVHVLKGITTHVNKGECICIIGPSGSGKFTFLRCLNPVSYTHLDVYKRQLQDKRRHPLDMRRYMGVVEY